jgi:hypothetical protein
LIRLIYAVLILVSIWIGLRRNPTFTRWMGVRLILVTVLLLAGITGLAIPAAHYAVDHFQSSPLLAMGMLFGTIGAGMAGATVVISKMMKLPQTQLSAETAPGDRPVYLHRRVIYVFGVVLVVVAAGCGAASYLLRDEAHIITGVIAALSIVFLLLLMTLGYPAARRKDVAVSAMMANPWVRWSYSQPEWERWVDVRFERAKAAAREPPNFGQLASTAAIVSGVSGLPFFIRYPAPMGIKSLCLLGWFLLLFGLLVWSAFDDRKAPEKMRARLMQAAPEVYLGCDGLLSEGKFATWLGADVYLVAATINEYPPRSIWFRFEKVQWNRYSGRTLEEVNRPVLIPEGRERDLELMQRELAEKCQKSEVKLV